MNEVVVFKGSTSGLELVFDRTIDFDMVLAKLKEKLESAADFFGVGAVVNVDGSSQLTYEERRQLVQLLADYGLNFREKTFIEEQRPSTDEKNIPNCTEDAQTLFVNKTLRGGQKIVYKGSIVVLGDVNPGAEVVAGGNIIVSGTCRGMAHAGANGDQAATITANRLLASQLRIAGVIARAPDDMSKPLTSEIAKIVNNMLVIEPANLEED